MEVACSPLVSSCSKDPWCVYLQVCVCMCVYDGLVTCPGSIPVSRLVAAGRGLDKQPSRKKKPVFPETPVEN